MLVQLGNKPINMLMDERFLAAQGSRREGRRKNTAHFLMCLDITLRNYRELFLADVVDSDLTKTSWLRPTGP